jgi:hypothetical protein
LAGAAPRSAVATPASNSLARVRKRALVGLPLRAGLGPEGGTQGRVGALEKLRFEHRASLCQQFGAALLCIDRHQAGQPDLGIQGVAVLLQGSSLLRDIGVFGVAAGGRCRPQFAQACIDVGQLRGACAHEAFGLRQDVIGEGVDGRELVLAVGRLGHLLQQRAQALST